MASAKDIVLRPIDRGTADRIIKAHHYSGRVVRNSQLHIGVFLGGRLEGALQFGPSLDKRKIQGLVEGTAWNGFLELNRMAFSERLPRNSESRALAVAMRMLRKHAPGIEWVVSFADATQSGDGTIYRAAGFVLTMVRPSHNLALLPDGRVVHKVTLQASPHVPRPELGGQTYAQAFAGRASFGRYLEATGARILPGFQLRYLYFLDPSARQRLTVPVLPFSEIDRLGAGMYRGKARRAPVEGNESPSPTGGANPTRTLQP